MEDPKNEEVLVVPTKALFPEGLWRGFRKCGEKEVLEIIKKEGRFLKRDLVETDVNWQQVVPQIILTCGNEIFLYHIPVTGDEKRLHGKWSFFLGGHVKNTDSGIKEASEREFREEVNYLGRIVGKTFCGMIKLDSPAVSMVHTGLVYIWKGDSKKFDVTKDGGIADCRFADLSTLEDYFDKMSPWPKVFMPYLRKIIRNIDF